MRQGVGVGPQLVLFALSLGGWLMSSLGANQADQRIEPRLATFPTTQKPYIASNVPRGGQ